MSDSFFIYIFEAPDSCYVLGGENFDAGKFRIHKESASGAVLWSKAYGGSGTQILKSMIGTTDGGYIMFGESYSNDGDVGFHYGSLSNRDLWVIKLDSVGEKQWSKVYGGTGDDGAASIIQIPGGGYYISGGTTSNDYDCTGNHGEYDVFVARLNDTGKILWHYDLGGTGTEGATYATQERKGGLIIAASSNSSGGDVAHHINPGDYNIWAISIDSSGGINWNNCYGGGGSEHPNCLCKANDGSIWIAGVSTNKGGQVDTAYGREDALFLHIDSAGSFLCGRVIGSKRDDNGAMIYPLSNGTVIAGGSFDSTGAIFSNISYGSADAFLINFAPWTTEVTTLSDNSFLKIYPNPSSEYVCIETEQQNAFTIAINDMLGRQVYFENVPANQHKTRIDISNWQKGMYFVALTQSNGYKTVDKLSVE